MFAIDHAPGRLSADDEGAGKISLQHPAPIGSRKIEHRLAELNAGIVDEDVDGKAIRIEGVESGDDRGLVRDIEGADEHAMAGGTQRFGRLSKFRSIASVQHDAGAGFGEAPHHRETQTARGAGDERRFAGKVEQRRHYHAPVRRTVRSDRS